jgi:hypothetical protein
VTSRGELLCASIKAYLYKYTSDVEELGQVSVADQELIGSEFSKVLGLE